jgi:hypothetical protein
VKALKESLRKKILEGTVLALDPASGGTSQPGWALSKASEVVSSGVFKTNKGVIQERLRSLNTEVLRFTEGVEISVVAVEMLPRRVHHYVMWSIGAVIAAIPYDVEVLEVPIRDWKEIARESSTYTKGDEQDALAILGAVLRAAADPGRAGANPAKRKPARRTHVRPRPSAALRVRGARGKRLGRVGSSRGNRG